MKIDCISDLHGHYPKLEGGDLLIVAGDLTASDRPSEYLLFAQWIAKQNYKHRVFIAGNHDNKLKNLIEMKLVVADYLCDSGIEFEGLKIWGTPWTKTFPGMNPHCKVFTCHTEEELMDKWELIPKDTDILITHSPPYGIFDGIQIEDGSLFHTGSVRLRNIVLSKERMPKLKLHCFGHIHEWGGHNFSSIDCEFVNASHVNEKYKPVNKPITIII